MARIYSFNRVIFAAVMILCIGIAGIGSNSFCRAEVLEEGSVYDDAGTNNLYVGYEDYDFGVFTVNDGSEFNRSRGYIGYGMDSIGTVIVTGEESIWTASSSLVVGYNGTGLLRVESGGEIIKLRICNIGLYSNGIASVTGTGSRLTFRDSISVGHSNSGRLRIEAGGQVTGHAQANIGHSSGSTGLVTVSGVGSKFKNTIFSIGLIGKGELRVNSGGEASNSTCYIGRLPDSSGTATITGTGSKWSSSELNVGLSGNGTMIIEDGGNVSSNSCFIGRSSSSTGTVTVTGTGSQWINNNVLHVSSEGQGLLTVVDGGEVSTGTFIGSLNDLSGNGTITANGAVLDEDFIFDGTNGSSQVFSFGTGGTLILTADGGYLGVGYKKSGTLRVADGVEIFSQNSYLGYLPGSKGTATVSGIGSRWNTGSSFHVGNSANQSMLRIEAGGQVISSSSYLAHGSDSIGKVIVTGVDSKWITHACLIAGFNGSGELNIMNGGLVSVGITLTIDYDEDGDSFINMASGGMLALNGDADESLDAFLDLVDGTDAIRYWDETISDWAVITDATEGEDYTLEYMAVGDLAGYTILTVTAVPEPTTLGLLGLGGLALLRRRKKS